MKVRGFLAILLCAALALGLCSMAAPQPDQIGSDAQLEAVTAKVKTALGLDTELYTDFQGWAQEDVLLGTRWELEWSGDGVWLSITADSQGKVYSYSLSQSVHDQPLADRSNGGTMTIPRLPEDKSAAALAAAQGFLSKVLEPGVETVDIADRYTPSLTQTSYRYTGTVLLNGLPSPIQCSVTVRASDLAVTRFWRGDQGAGYLGGVPAPARACTQAEARTLLASPLSMSARFVREPDSNTAKVRYLPDSGDEYYVDGQTGQLVDLTQLRAQLWRDGGGTNTTMGKFEAAADLAAEAPAAGASLTQAEKDGAAILAAALSKEELDKAVQTAWPEMGLDRYTLSSASFSLSKKDLPDGVERTPEDYVVTCRLTYGRQEDQLLRNKYVTVDAKTGEVKGLYSRRWYQGDKEETLRLSTDVSAAQATAQAVLGRFDAVHFPVMALADSTDAAGEKSAWEHRFTFQHTAGGWFFPDNAYTLGVDATDGTLSSLSGTFDGDVVLEVPQSVVSPAQAVAAYADAMAVSYGYLEVPVSISLAGQELMPLLKEAGYSYVNALKTGYGLTQPENSYVQGVYAQTGQAIVDTYDRHETEPLTYDDLAGHWVEPAAQALAVFQVGLRGGSLRPDDPLTQLDLLALLTSTQGMAYDPAAATADDTDWLYQRGYSYGLVTPETRQEDKVISRGELVRTLLDSQGYDRVAALPGIFRCDYADSASIPAAELGYAALAQGLGLINGGSAGAYAPTRPITRGEAVAVLYQYMK